MSAVESMRFICGGCGYRARIPSSYTGKVILCPGCQQTQIASADGGEATGDTVRVSKVATAPGTGRFSVPEADGRLRFTCTGCGYSAKLASTYAGKAISCPKCTAPQLIPPLQGPEGGAGKAQPSPALEPAAAPSADDGLNFDDEPAAKPASASKPNAPAKPSTASLTKPNAPKAPASAADSASASPSNKSSTGNVVRRGSRASMPAVEPVEDEDDVEAAEKKPTKPLPPWAQKLKEPRMMAIIGGCAAALILQIVLISGWVSAAQQAKEFRETATTNENRANGLEKLKSAAEFDLSKSSEEVNRLKKAESEAKAALAASETRLMELGEQLKKAEADKAEEYARRKKAEAEQDDMFAKLKAAEKKRDDEYRITTELRRKYDEEVKLRKDLKVRLDEALAASK